MKILYEVGKSNKYEGLRLVDALSCFMIERYMLFDNSYNYDQSYQWIEIFRSDSLKETKQVFDEYVLGVRK